MTDSINVDESIETPTTDKDSIIQDLQKQLEAVKSKSSELLAETKQAKQKARDESEAKERAKTEKAKRDGDFEQLLKSSESKNKELADKYNSLQTQISQEKVRTESMKLAAELADGTNAELLSEFINKRLSYTEEGIKVLTASGELTVSTIDDLKAEFQKSDKFKPLLRGIKANGGGAQGSISGAKLSAGKEMSRKSFESMSAGQQQAFAKDRSNKIID